MRLNLSRSGRRRLAVATASVVAVAGVAVVSTLPAYAAAACQVTYSANPWTESPGVGGFTANITITNTGDALTAWTLRFTLPSGQSFTQAWPATWTVGPAVTGASLSYNGTLGTGASTGVG